MTDLDQGPVEPQSPFGLPQRSFHVQAVEQTGSYAPLQQQAFAPPQHGSYSPHHSRSEAPPVGMPAKSPVAALVCGILAWVPVLGWFTAIPAIILGVKGRRAAREGRTEKGGMATTGLWLGGTSMVVGALMIPIMAAIVFPVFLNQRHKGIDLVLERDMRQMSSLQYAYIKANPGKRGFDVAATTPGGTVTTPGVAFAASPGNVIAVVVTPEGFCLSGYNPGASKAISPTASKIYLSGSRTVEAGVGTCD